MVHLADTALLHIRGFLISKLWITKASELGFHRRIKNMKCCMQSIRLFRTSTATLIITMQNLSESWNLQNKNWATTKSIQKETRWRESFRIDLFSWAQNSCDWEIWIGPKYKRIRSLVTELKNCFWRTSTLKRMW